MTQARCREGGVCEGGSVEVDGSKGEKTPPDCLGLKPKNYLMSF